MPSGSTRYVDGSYISCASPCSHPIQCRHHISCKFASRLVTHRRARTDSALPSVTIRISSDHSGEMVEPRMRTNWSCQPAECCFIGYGAGILFESFCFILICIKPLCAHHRQSLRLWNQIVTCRTIVTSLCDLAYFHRLRRTPYVIGMLPCGVSLLRRFWPLFEVSLLQKPLSLWGSLPGSETQPPEEVRFADHIFLLRPTPSQACRRPRTLHTACTCIARDNTRKSLAHLPLKRILSCSK